MQAFVSVPLLYFFITYSQLALWFQLLNCIRPITAFCKLNQKCFCYSVIIDQLACIQCQIDKLYLDLYQILFQFLFEELQHVYMLAVHDMKLHMDDIVRQYLIINSSLLTFYHNVIVMFTGQLVRCVQLIPTPIIGWRKIIVNKHY